MAASFQWANSISAVAPAATIAKTSDSVIDPDGNLYVVGSGKDTVSFGPGESLPSVSVETAYLAKYSATGSLLFKRALPTSAAGVFQVANTLRIDGSRNLYIGGRTQDSKAALLKVDSVGNTVWGFSIGGASGVNTVNDLALDNNGNVVAVGSFQGQIDVDPSGGTRTLTSIARDSEAFFAKYTSAGTLVLAGATEGRGSNAVLGNAVAIDSQNNIVIVGGFNGLTDFNPLPGQNTINGSIVGELSTPSALDPFVMQITETGVFSYARSLKGEANGAAAGRVSAATDIAIEGNATYISGTVAGRVTVDAGARTVFAEGGAAGSAFLVKYRIEPFLNNFTSIYEWISVAGGGPSRGEAVATDGKGNITLAGTYQGSVQFNTGFSSIQPSATGKDVFLARYLADGRLDGLNGLLSGNGPGEFSEGSLGVTSLTVQPSTGDLLVTGSYSGTAGAPSGSTPPASRFGSIVLPELGRQGGLAVGEAGNAFLGRVSPIAVSPRLTSATVLQADDDSTPKGDFATVNLTPRLVGSASGPGLTVDLVNATTGAVLATTTTDGAGNYVLRHPSVGIGRQNLIVRVRDAEQVYPSPAFGLTLGFATSGTTPPPAPITGARVVATRIALVKVRKRGPKQKVIEVDFDGTFQSLSVQGTNNYVLRSAGKDRRFDTRDDKILPIRTLAYNAATRKMTLTPRAKLAANLILRLTVTGLIGGTPSVTFLGRPARP